MTKLTQMKCIPCEGGFAPLNKIQAQDFLKQLNSAWVLSSDMKFISRRFEFKGFQKTIGFVNALAWVVNQENHHPDLRVGYNYCEVTFTTHAIDGLSENDFICAAKVDAL
jgi:4a-hydroxytetrahydrobiopterin dehydratase